MRVWVVLLLLLGGCAGQGGGARSDDLYVNVSGQGEWELHLPVPQDALFGVGTWRESLRVSSGHATLEWQLGEMPLIVRGNGSVRLEALPRIDAPACCLLDHREALWSSGPAAEGLPVHVEQGRVTQIHLDHHVLVCRSGCDPGQEPKVCTQRINVQATALEAGRHVLAVPHIGRTC